MPVVLHIGWRIKVFQLKNRKIELFHQTFNFYDYILHKRLNILHLRTGKPEADGPFMASPIFNIEYF